MDPIALWNALPKAATWLTCSFLVYIYIRSCLRWKARARGRLLPPGPVPLPFLGNIFDIPSYKPWIAHRDACSKYGDVVHFQILNRHMVILGTSDVVFEYLDKRSANTSDRNDTPLNELVGAEVIFSAFRYGSWWRRHRRAFWQHFHPKANMGYRATQRQVAHRFLFKMLTDPTQLKKHIRYAFAAAMMKIVYGNDTEKDIEEQMERVALYQEGISQGLVPGKFLLEYLPFLSRLPACFLGAELRQKSPKWRAASTALKNVPFTRYVNQQVDNDAPNDTSLLGKMLPNLDLYDAASSVRQEEEDIMKNTATIAFEAGSDTMFSTFQTTFLAMSLYPDILKKAQMELDAVVGPNRLPDWGDRKSLPYISAIIKESLRWQNVLPLSVPHAVVSDDELRGYFIPAGTLLIPNTWACMHDAEVYPDPEVFRPERFLKDGELDHTVRDPAAFVFGYGRRICPGRYFAEESLFINTASALHVFDITPPSDEHGRPIKIEPQMSDGIMSYPEDSRCTVKVRSAQAEALIRDARQDAFAGNIQ